MSLRIFPRLLKSKVPEHEGYCIRTWANTNYWVNQGIGGVSGLFCNVRKICPGIYWMINEEFHGLVLWDTTTAFSGEQCYNPSDYRAKARRLGIIQ